MVGQVADMLEVELNAIRLSLYEETKDMTSEEKIAYIKARTEPAVKRFGIRTSPLEPLTPKKRVKASSE